MPAYFQTPGKSKFYRYTGKGRRNFLNDDMDGFGAIGKNRNPNAVKSTKKKQANQPKDGKTVWIMPTAENNSGGNRVKVVKVNRTQAQAVSNNGGTIVKKTTNGETQVVSNGGGITDKIFSIVSQWITGNSRNQTVQTIGGTIPLYQNQGDGGGGGVTIDENTAAALVGGGVGQTVGGTLGGGLDGIFSWAQNNLGLVLVGVGAIYLLFKQPPKYGNR